MHTAIVPPALPDFDTVVVGGEERKMPRSGILPFKQGKVLIKTFNLKSRVRRETTLASASRMTHREAVPLRRLWRTRVGASDPPAGRAWPALAADLL